MPGTPGRSRRGSLMPSAAVTPSDWKLSTLGVPAPAGLSGSSQSLHLLGKDLVLGPHNKNVSKIFTI